MIKHRLMWNDSTKKTKTLVISAIVAATVSVLFFIKNPKPPQQVLNSAKAALDSAFAAGAKKYAPERYQFAEELFTAGYIEMGRQRGRLRPLRDFSLAESMLKQAKFQADSAAISAKDSIYRLEIGIDAEINAVESMLDSRKRTLDSLLLNPDDHIHWVLARDRLEVARKLFAEKSYEDATELIAQSRYSLNYLDLFLSEYFHDESRKIPVWRAWVEQTLSLSKKQNSHAIIVDKSAHRLYLVKAGKLVNSWPCELGRNRGTQKKHAGDAATPEGRYRITSIKTRGSKYYKALGIDYPNPDDIARFKEGKKKGIVPSSAGPGGSIEIHGMGGRGIDWTEGCIALRNQDIDSLIKVVSVGTPVTVVRKSDRWP
ncbi:MAG: L,D-transpeptidase family protein [bacterium]